MKRLKKVLIANRSEIAVRIIRTLKEMGIRSIAVYSEADRKALHVRKADEAYYIGPASSSQSYLDQDKLIQTALDADADGIHPGYGFLSENASFARKVIEAGLIFIGPSPESIEIMGDKLSAKHAASQFDIPMVPGGNKAISDLTEALSIAESVGFPILIKASAGGGGKGMRIVDKAEHLAQEFSRATSEALAAFGDGSVFIEKYVASPAHIEIQILGDQQGNIIYLFERECSVQRRYQKVVEEAPSPKIDEILRKKIGEAAVKVAQACQYYGAGTVEFIMDENKNFYFLEMNTRLQVEHPVTEMITGIDLVREQLYIAEGKPLSFKQNDLSWKGHAIELRVYAEDPANEFLPFTGTLTRYQKPAGPGIRIDEGFEEGLSIPVFYDPMIAKLIVHAANREEAIERMKRAIDEYEITGIETTLGFGKFVMQHESFRSGTFDTHFVKNYFDPKKLTIPLNEEEMIAAAIFSMIFFEEKSSEQISRTQRPTPLSKWRTRKD